MPVEMGSGTSDPVASEGAILRTLTILYSIYVKTSRLFCFRLLFTSIKVGEKAAVARHLSVSLTSYPTSTQFW